MPTTEQIRNATWHHLSPSVAATAGLTIPQLQQFCAGAVMPTAAQLQALAAAMGLMPKFDLFTDTRP